MIINPLPSACAWRKVLRWSIKTQSGCLISYDLCVPESLEILAYPAHTHTQAINCDEWLCLRVALTWMNRKWDRCEQARERGSRKRGKPADTDHFAAITRDVALLLNTDVHDAKTNSFLPQWTPPIPRVWLVNSVNDSLDTCFPYLTKGIGFSWGHGICVCACMRVWGLQSIKHRHSAVIEKSNPKQTFAWAHGYRNYNLSIKENTSQPISRFWTETFPRSFSLWSLQSPLLPPSFPPSLCTGAVAIETGCQVSGSGMEWVN